MASIASRLLFGFVTPVVGRASRLEKLASADLPPLSEMDHVRSLIKLGYPVRVHVRYISPVADQRAGARPVLRWEQRSPFLAIAPYIREDLRLSSTCHRLSRAIPSPQLRRHKSALEVPRDWRGTCCRPAPLCSIWMRFGRTRPSSLSRYVLSSCYWTV
jgi:hypothetical protein